MTGVKTNERPGTRAVHRHCGMSASKARQVLDLIRGEDVQRAAEILTGTEREAAEVIGKVLTSAVANAAHNDSAEPRGALRLGLLRRRGRHHEALASPGPGPGHADPQAHLPHHDHREPAAGRPARAAPPPHGGGQRQPVPPGRRLASPGRPVRARCRAAGPPRRRPRPRRRRPTEAEDEARRDDGVTDEAVTDDTAADETATRPRRTRRGRRRRRRTRTTRRGEADEDDRGPTTTRTTRARTSRWARR